MRFPITIFFAISFSLSVNARAQSGATTFQDFLAAHSTAIFPAEKDSVFQRFWRSATRRGFPYIEQNKTDVVFLHRGRDSLRITGDFTSWSFSVPFRHVPETDLWYVKFTFEPDARLDYKFISNISGYILDTLNPKTSQSGFGVNSELTMPDYQPSPETIEQREAPRGTVSSISVPSKLLGYDHTVSIYLPPGYDTSKAYPTMYVQDGADYLNHGRAATILDNLTASKLSEKVIGVFINPPSQPERNRATEYSMNRRYEGFVVTELVPLVDKAYSTRKSASGRLVVGSSFGGLISLSIAFNHPDVFANAASQSGYFSFRSDTLINLFQQSTTRPLKIYLCVGTYERSIGGTASANSEGDFLTSNRNLAKVLERKSYNLRYREYHDGHSWARWRNDLPQILRWFFPYEGFH